MPRPNTTPRSVTLTYPAMTAYKQWVWVEIRRRKLTLQGLVDEMKRIGRSELAKIPTTKGKTMLDTLSTSTLINLIGPEGGTPPPSNCAFMPTLNKVLGLAPPPICDPDEKLSQLVDRFRARWANATHRERAALVALLADPDDEGGVDRDRNGAGESSPATHRAR